MEQVLALLPFLCNSLLVNSHSTRQSDIGSIVLHLHGEILELPKLAEPALLDEGVQLANIVAVGVVHRWK